ncbi:MAG: phosphotransferase [Acidimicrobiales bacterium]
MPKLSELKARKTLMSVGLDASKFELACSVTNEVWLTETHAVRFNKAGDGRLRREAFLSRHLPAELRYPPIVAYGGEVGADYLILERIPGRPLAHCWASMSDSARQNAVTQLSHQLQLLHHTRTPQELPAIEAPQLLRAGAANAAEPLMRAIEDARRLPHVDTTLMSDVSLLVHEQAQALEPFNDTTLVHGDLTFENILWDGRKLTMLDYEWAHGAPPDVDLDILLRCCALPFLHVAPAYERLADPRDYRNVPGWLAQAYPALFEVPRLGARLVLYSISFDMRELLRFPPRVSARDLSPHHPLNRMRQTIDGRSYIARFAAALTR